MSSATLTFPATLSWWLGLPPLTSRTTHRSQHSQHRRDGDSANIQAYTDRDRDMDLSGPGQNKLRFKAAEDKSPVWEHQTQAECEASLAQ